MFVTLFVFAGGLSHRHPVVEQPGGGRVDGRTAGAAAGNVDRRVCRCGRWSASGVAGHRQTGEAALADDGCGAAGRRCGRLPADPRWDRCHRGVSGCGGRRGVQALAPVLVGDHASPSCAGGCLAQCTPWAPARSPAAGPGTDGMVATWRCVPALCGAARLHGGFCAVAGAACALRARFTWGTRPPLRLRAARPGRAWLRRPRLRVLRSFLLPA